MTNPSSSNMDSNIHPVLFGTPSQSTSIFSSGSFAATSKATASKKSPPSIFDSVSKAPAITTFPSITPKSKNAKSSTPRLSFGSDSDSDEVSTPSISTKKATGRLAKSKKNMFSAAKQAGQASVVSSLNLTAQGTTKTTTPSGDNGKMSTAGLKFNTSASTETSSTSTPHQSVEGEGEEILKQKLNKQNKILKACFKIVVDLSKTHGCDGDLSRENLVGYITAIADRIQMLEAECREKDEELEKFASALLEENAMLQESRNETESAKRAEEWFTTETYLKMDADINALQQDKEQLEQALSNKTAEFNLLKAAQSTMKHNAERDASLVRDLLEEKKVVERALAKAEKEYKLLQYSLNQKEALNVDLFNKYKDLHKGSFAAMTKVRISVLEKQRDDEKEKVAKLTGENHFLKFRVEALNTKVAANPDWQYEAEELRVRNDQQYAYIEGQHDYIERLAIRNEYLEEQLRQRSISYWAARGAKLVGMSGFEEDS